MKKIILILAAFISCAQLIAQPVEKGTVLVGASSNLNFGNYSFPSSQPDATILLLNFKSGYFFADNFAGGINIGYFNSSQSSSSTTYSEFGAFLRGYVQGKFFAGIGLSSVTESYSSGSSSSSTSKSHTVIPFELGYAAFITPFFALEPSLRYVKGDDTGGITFNGLSVGAKSMIGIHVGFTFYPGRTKGTSE